MKIRILHHNQPTALSDNFIMSDGRKRTDPFPKPQAKARRPDKPMFWRHPGIVPNIEPCSTIILRDDGTRKCFVAKGVCVSDYCSRLHVDCKAVDGDEKITMDLVWMGGAEVWFDRENKHRYKVAGVVKGTVFHHFYVDDQKECPEVNVGDFEVKEELVGEEEEEEEEFPSLSEDDEEDEDEDDE